MNEDPNRSEAEIREYLSGNLSMWIASKYRGGSAKGEQRMAIDDFY